MDLRSSASFLAAVVSNLVGIGLFLYGYVGYETDVAFGPDVAWLVERSEREDWGLVDHHMALIAAFPSFVDANLETLREKALYRRLGILCLSAAVLLVTASVLLLMISTG